MKKIIFLLLFLVTAQFISAKDAAEGIRGVWVPAPRFTSVLHSYENVKEFVGLLDELNMNAVFLVSYAETKTIYRSEVLKRNSTYETVDDTWMLKDYVKDYSSKTMDPVRDLIDEAHKHNIKVFFWFEYGFMGEGRPIPSDNPILAKNPHWIGVGNDQQPANYNKSDYYFNSYNPAVQNFLVDLILESISLYPDIDGIQGDDRLPAMPRNSGYDVYTVSRFQAEHNGQLPPSDFNDKAWVDWRLDILNDFAVELYNKVKAANKNVMTSFAPNPYPWCEEMLMQDWPEWCRLNTCDLLAVQCYRYSEEAYRSTVSEVLKYLKESNPKQLFAPGIILMEGSSSKMTPELLGRQIEINRELGLVGEVFFYNKALENPIVKKVLKKYYKKKVKFPEINR